MPLSNEKKIKLLASVLAVAVLYAAVIGLLIKWQDDLALLSALLGTAAGWTLGTLSSPWGKPEIRQFREFGKILSAFITGFVVSKVDHLLSLTSADNHGPVLLEPMVIRRLMLGAACLLTAMMIVFVARRYFPVDA
jgi:hypothetical protein